jgi:hypothetical protein
MEWTFRLKRRQQRPQTESGREKPRPLILWRDSNDPDIIRGSGQPFKKNDFIVH